MTRRLLVLLAPAFLLAAAADPLAADDAGGDLPLTLAEELFPQEKNKPKDEDGLFLGARVGLWNIGEYEAITINGERHIKRESVYDVGADLGLRVGLWSLFVNVDYGFSSDVSVVIGGVNAGLAVPIEKYAFFDIIPAPEWIHVSVGLIAGRFEVDDGDFGDFEDAVGIQARFAFLWAVDKGVRFDVWVEYRNIDFEYEDQVISGDENAVETSAAFGGSLVLKW